MVKFIEKEQEQISIQYKLDKKLKEKDDAINECIDEFNRFKFDAKYQNHVLSQKMMELQLQKMEEEEEKARPMNDE